MTIQSMINAAPPGGTVSVIPGTYFEQLVIDKPLSLEGPNPATGEAIINAAGMANVPTLLITSSHVTVRFMSFQNGPGQGIRVGTASFSNLEEVLIECNRIQENDWGAYNQTATVINAMNNWWGDSSGPYHPVKNPGGTGNPVSNNINFIPWKKFPPLPPPTEIDCIKTIKIYGNCKKFQVNEVVVDVSKIAEGEVVNAECFQINLVVDQQHLFMVKKIPGTNQVRTSFYFEYTIKFQDNTGWKVLTNPPIFHQKTFIMPSLVQDQRINVTADIYLECLECFVSGYHQITCCIGKIILLQLTSPVQLLIPTYGFCPEPNDCLQVSSKCLDYSTVYLPYPSQ